MRMYLGLGLGLIAIYTCFFFKCWPGRTGSIQFNWFQTLKIKTEPEFFCDFLIG